MNKEETKCCCGHTTYCDYGSKQETLEEFIENRLCGIFFNSKVERGIVKEFIEIGAKWQQERSYSEEEVIKLLEKRDKYVGNWLPPIKWLKQTR